MTGNAVHAAASQVLRRLALASGARIMAIYGESDLGVRAKGDGSPVTAADMAADAVICDGLAAAFPDIPIVTEERADSHLTDGAVTHFLVDPLDGTKEFVSRNGEFTVNIALIEGGQPTVGVVYAPAVGRLFLTVSGNAVEERISDPSAQDGGAQGPARTLRTVVADAAALRVVASKSHRDAATDAYISRYPVAAFKSAGSSLKFCLVAAGEADFYPRLGRTMEWDTAAGHAVLAAAGGRVVRLEDGAPLRYGKPGRENPWFAAFGGGVGLVAPPDGAAPAASR